MFDLTTIQLINNHPQDRPFRTRDLTGPKNIRKSWEALLGGAEYIRMEPEQILDMESCFSPPSFTDGEWEARQFHICCHCFKQFKVAPHDPTDTWTCSQECRDAWVPF